MDVEMFSIGIDRLSNPDIIPQAACPTDYMGLSCLRAPEYTLHFDEAYYSSKFPDDSTGGVMMGCSDILDPFAILSCETAHTSNIKFDPAVFLVSHHNYVPAVKKILASLDQPSEGRLIFLAGLRSLIEEFESLGVSPSQGYKHMSVDLNAMKVLWSRDSSSHNGNSCQSQPFIIAPKPLHTLRPSIVFVSNIISTVRQAGQYSKGRLAINTRQEPAGCRVTRNKQLTHRMSTRSANLLRSVCTLDQFELITRDMLNHCHGVGIQQHVTCLLPTQILAALPGTR